MTFSYKKQANHIVISIEDLKKLVPEYQVKVFNDHVEIEDIAYEMDYLKSLERAKNAPESDFVNL